MKIGMEVTGCLTETPTGIANYIINLYKELVRTGHNPTAYIWLPNYKHRDLILKYFTPDQLSWHFKNYNFHRLVNDLDISHTTDSKFLNIPRTKRVATVHDLAIFRKETLGIPEYTTEKFKTKMLAKLRVIAEKSDRIITASNQSKLDFLEMFPSFDADRIHAVYLADSLSADSPAEGNDEQVLRQFGIEKGAYFIFIGAVSIRKNLVNMIEAFKASGLAGDTKFLLIGFKSMGIGRILQTIERLGLRERVVLADFIEEGLIPALYRNALGLAFATYYEGFGIPIIEAMKFRTPVMFGNIGAAPEIAQDHGISVDPFSIGEIADGFRALTEFGHERLEKALSYAKGFSWEKTAAETVAVYRKML